MLIQLNFEEKKTDSANLLFVNSKEKYERPKIDFHLRKETIGDGQTLGLGCVEGAFFCHAVPCAVGFNDPHYIPMMLFMQYLTQLEGPFWRQLRGQGNFINIVC